MEYISLCPLPIFVQGPEIFYPQQHHKMAIQVPRHHSTLSIRLPRVVFLYSIIFSFLKQKTKKKNQKKKRNSNTQIILVSEKQREKRGQLYFIRINQKEWPQQHSPLSLFLLHPRLLVFNPPPPPPPPPNVSRFPLLTSPRPPPTVSPLHLHHYFI